MVSIILLSYNSEETIEETLNSIFLQTYEKIELILTDDASSDHTVDRVKEWLGTHEDRFCNVEILTSKNNTGVTANCNRGLRKAKGKYIQFIAGDDIFLPEAMEIRVAMQKKFPDKIIITKVENFGDPKLSYEREKWCERGYQILKKDRKYQFRQLLLGNYIAGPSGAFFERTIYDKVGEYDERFPMVEDYPFLVKLMANGYEFVLIDRITTRYRNDSGSICHSDGISAFADSMDDFFKLVKGKLLLEKGMVSSHWSTKVPFCCAF